jgi:hypothetical protein
MLLMEIAPNPSKSSKNSVQYRSCMRIAIHSNVKFKYGQGGAMAVGGPSITSFLRSDLHQPPKSDEVCVGAVCLPPSPYLQLLYGDANKVGHRPVAAAPQLSEHSVP